MNEEWRAVLDGNYEVSNQGNVRRATAGRNTYAGRPMKAVLLNIGYLKVAPTVNGKNKDHYVHQLVAEAFIGPRPECMSINHKDGNKTNNQVENLEYVTHAENMAHASHTGLMRSGTTHPATILSSERVQEVRTARANGLSYSSIARLYSISISHVWQIVQGNARRNA